MSEINIGLTGKTPVRTTSKNGNRSDYIIEARIGNSGWHMLGRFEGETNPGRTTVVKRWSFANKEKLAHFVNQYGPGELNVRALSHKSYNVGEVIV